MENHGHQRPEDTSVIEEEFIISHGNDFIIILITDIRINEEKGIELMLTICYHVRYKT